MNDEPRTPVDPKVINRIRGLLAQAEGTDNEHEAATFFAHAEVLMDRYRLDMEAVRPAGTGPAFGQTLMYLGGEKYLRASLSLLVGVARHYGVVVLTPMTGNSKWPTLVGTELDVTATKLMFQSLLIQRDRFVIAEPVPYGTNTLTFRTSFAYGFAVRVVARLQEIRDRQRAAVAGDSTALELYDRFDLVDRWAKENDDTYDGGSTSRNAPRMNRDGILAGDAAGHRADLGQERIGNAGQPALEARST